MTDTWTWATVTQSSPLRIKVDGDTSALDATTDNLVGSLAVDDRVRVHLHSDGIIVTGLQGGGDVLTIMSGPGNLNEVPYVSNGRFHQSSDSNATAGANYPVPYAGMLEVSSASGFIYQRYTAYAPYSAVYFRAYYTATGWGAWSKQLVEQAWTSWTPTLTGAGWSAGNSSTDGGYKIIDGVAHVWGRITFGTTATFGSGAPTIPLPFTAAPRSNPINMWLFVGGVGIYVLIGRAISSAIYGYQNGGAGFLSAWTSTSPATLASGNYLDFTAIIVVA